jgi:hypothetical protein
MNAAPESESAKSTMPGIAYLAQGRIRIKTTGVEPYTIHSSFGNSIREKAIRAQQRHSGNRPATTARHFPARYGARQARVNETYR